MSEFALSGMKQKVNLKSSMAQLYNSMVAILQ